MSIKPAQSAWQDKPNETTPLNAVRLNYERERTQEVVEQGLLPSVLQYGADPTGVADSTTAFNAMKTAEGRIYVPPGTYKIEGQINVTNGVLQGAGMDATILNLTTTTPATVGTYTGTSETITGTIFVKESTKGCEQIRDLTIKSSATSGGAIVLLKEPAGTGYTNPTIWKPAVVENIYIEGGFHGIVVCEAASPILRNIFVEGNGKKAGSFGVWFGSCGGPVLQMFTCQNRGIGLRIKGCTAPVVENCEILGSGERSLYWEANFYGRCSNCYFDSSPKANKLLNSGVDNVFQGCWFQGGAEAAGEEACCVVEGQTDLRFMGCAFTSGQFNGCIVPAGNRGVRFVGCSFDANSGKAEGVYHGLILEGCVETVVQDCMFGNVGGLPTGGGNQGNGIRVTAATARFVIMANNFFNPVKHAIENESTEPRKISANIIFNTFTQNSVVATESSALLTLTAKNVERLEAKKSVLTGYAGSVFVAGVKVEKVNSPTVVELSEAAKETKTANATFTVSEVEP